MNSIEIARLSMPIFSINIINNVLVNIIDILKAYRDELNKTYMTIFFLIYWEEFRRLFFIVNSVKILNRANKLFYFF